jgi:dihydroflavonol-4-reductase
MDRQKKNVFVTGGTGLVGSHLIYKLTLAGERVRAVHRKNSNRSIVRKVLGYYSDNPEDLLSNVEWVECDICDYDRLNAAMKGTEIVYHCAASVLFEPDQGDFILNNNVLGTRNVVRACLETGIKKLCHVSSNAALGASDMEIMVNEDHKWNDEEYHSAYGTSKHLSEEEVWKGIAAGLNAVIVNPTFILGPGDWTRGSSSFFSNVDRGLLFYTKGASGYVYVNDVAEVMIALVESNISGERFIVSSENLSFHQFFTMIARGLGVRKPMIRIPRAFSPFALPLAKISEFITRKKSPLTRDILKSAWSRVTYDNSKIINRTGISFTPIEKAVKAISEIYLSEKAGNRGS